MNYPKRIIEVDLPIARISAHARREKSIRHGHISTLHIWWARRPLAACRAVVLASLWPDPEDLSRPEGWDAPVKPARFLDEARLRMRAWSKDQKALCGPESLKHFIEWDKKPEKLDDPAELRKALLDFIADFSDWDNSTNKAYLETSRALTQAAHESLGGEPGTRPLVVDPFAGGGSIPLESLRVGADAFASDLNPVAVLLNKVALEYIPRYGQRLADEVRKWGQWVKEQAEKELAQFYPQDPDGAKPLTYLWARTIRCEGPGCGAEIPLLRSLWLAKRPRKSVALKMAPRKDRTGVSLTIVQNATFKEVAAGTVKRSAAICPCCGFITSAEATRTQFRDRNGGAADARLVAVVTDRANGTGRNYRTPTDLDLQTTAKAAQRLASYSDLSEFLPDESLPYLRSIFNINLLGVSKWRDLFSPRQLLAIATLSRLVGKAWGEMSSELSADLATAVATVLACAVDRQADYSTSLCSWHLTGEKINHTYGRQALGIIWDFAESCPFADASGNFEGALKWVTGVCELNGSLAMERGTVQRASAAEHPLPEDSVDCFVTDPPYYDAVPYADLSDFFFVWLKRSLKDAVLPELRGQLTQKDGEIVQLAERNTAYAFKTKAYFEQLMMKALAEGRRTAKPAALGVVVFAHKTTGAWETMLQAVIDAGWIIQASWPIDTEMGTRLRAMNSATLSSSVHLVCRPREDEHGRVREDETGEWRDVLGELPKRVHDWLVRLDKEGVHGADAIFACLGPALEIFSRYSRVEKSDGSQVVLREYLEHVWAAVSKEALALLFKDADSGGLEPDARLTAMWMWTLNPAAGNGNGKSTGKVTGKVTPEDESADEEAEEEDEGASAKTAPLKGFALEYDAARKIAQGLGIHLEKHPDLVEVKGDKARLLSVAERVKFLFGKSTEADKAKRAKKTQGAKQTNMFEELQQAEAESGGRGFDVEGPKPGNTILDRVHQAMLLFGAGRGDALKRFLVDDGAGKEPAFWRLADTLVKLYPKSTDERRWAEGVVARKKGLGL